MTQVPCAFPTRTRRLLYGLLMMLCGRRQLLWLGASIYRGLGPLI